MEEFNIDDHLPECFKGMVGGDLELIEKSWNEGKYRLTRFEVGDKLRIIGTDIGGIVAEIHPNGWFFGLDGRQSNDFYWNVPWSKMWEKVSMETRIRIP